MPSTFEENLGLSQFEDIHEYPVATANHKAVEVYRRLVVGPGHPSRRNLQRLHLDQEQDPDDPPDLVIAGLCTLILNNDRVS